MMVSALYKKISKRFHSALGDQSIIIDLK